MDPMILGVIGLVLLLVFIFLGINLALTFFVIGFFGIVIIIGWDASWVFIESIPFLTLQSFNFTVIPLFVLMGMVIFECGIGEEIFQAVRNWTGHFSGGIAAATSGACAFLGTMTGSGAASAALMAKVAYPEMVKYDYDKPLSLATCAASSTAAMMIPPSTHIVVLAILASESIGACLMAGIIPGFLSMGIYMLMLLIRIRFKPNLGPALPAKPWRERFISLRYLIPAVIMMITIMGGIYFGVITATEAGGVGAFAAILIAIALKKFTRARIKNIILQTVKFSVLIMLMVMTITGYYIRFLNMTGITGALAEMALSFPSPWVTLAALGIITFLFGMFIGSSLGYIIIPLFAPVLGDMGFSLVWIIILQTKLAETGSITPPVCLAVFIAQGVIGDDEVSITDAYRAVWWFVLCDMLTLALLVTVPAITLFLPNTMR
jgi:tripartite ATP-independent transporter DctM subunit